MFVFFFHTTVPVESATDFCNPLGALSQIEWTNTSSGVISPCEIDGRIYRDPHPLMRRRILEFQMRKGVNLDLNIFIVIVMTLLFFESRQNSDCTVTAALKKTSPC